MHLLYVCKLMMIVLQLVLLAAAAWDRFTLLVQVNILSLMGDCAWCSTPMGSSSSAWLPSCWQDRYTLAFAQNIFDVPVVRAHVSALMW
jgi:hypothetical protein